MAISRTQIQQQVDECLAAITQVKQGLTVRFGDRMVTRADLDSLHRDLAIWERKLAGKSHSFVTFP